LISIARQVIDWFSMRHDSISCFTPSLHTYLLVLFKQICRFIHSISGQKLFSRLKDVSTSCFLETTFSNAYGRFCGTGRSMPRSFTCTPASRRQSRADRQIGGGDHYVNNQREWIGDYQQ
jgi:hypothetical protein